MEASQATLTTSCCSQSCTCAGKLVIANIVEGYSPCSIANCTCGENCKCSLGECSPCLCVGCDGSPCQCGDKCMCTKRCCPKATCTVCGKYTLSYLLLMMIYYVTVENCYCGSNCKCTSGSCCICTCEFEGCPGPGKCTCGPTCTCENKAVCCS